MRIDMHTHSRVSDGTSTPTELMHEAAAAGVDVVALTDHDSTAGWAEATAAVPRTGVALVRGTEISCTAGGISVHLLSYLHDPDDADLAAVLETSRTSRDGRAQEMVQRLAEDVELSWADVQAQAADGATIGRPHIADALMTKGYVADRAEAFASLLSPAAKYYVRYHAPAAVDVVRLVRAAGGVPVFAHPRASARGRVVAETVIREMARAGLAGLEVHHRDHTGADREYLAALAADLGLLVTGSSDFHGFGKPNRLAEHTTSEEVLDVIATHGKMEVVLP